MPTTNLSEKLFKPTFNSPETSTLINRGQAPKNLSNTCWYRDIRKAIWAWRGIDPIETSEVLARIAISTNPRTSAEQLDTVIGYRQGNWSYEWAVQAFEWQKKAQEIAEQDVTDNDVTDNDVNNPHKPKNDLTGRYWLRAAMLYSIAGYPYLRNDRLAAQMEVLSFKAYSEATALLPGHCRTIDFNVDNNKLTGFLYLPNVEKGPYPTVVLCSNPTSLQQDHHRLFYDYLLHEGIALLSLDCPGVGYSSHWKLSFDTSYLYQQILSQMMALPWVDQHNIFVLGIRAGANAAIRLAYLEPKRLRGAISFAGMVHYGLTSGQFVSSLSEMYKDVLTSRLGLTSLSDSMLQAELACYSLKNQGLLGRRCQTPMLAIAIENDKISPIEESRLIADSSSDGKLLMVPSSPVRSGLHTVANTISHWIKKQLV